MAEFGAAALASEPDLSRENIDARLRRALAAVRASRGARAHSALLRCARMPNDRRTGDAAAVGDLLTLVEARSEEIAAQVARVRATLSAGPSSGSWLLGTSPSHLQPQPQPQLFPQAAAAVAPRRSVMVRDRSLTEQERLLQEEEEELLRQEREFEGLPSLLCRMAGRPDADVALQSGYGARPKRAWPASVVGEELARRTTGGARLRCRPSSASSRACRRETYVFAAGIASRRAAR